MKTFAEKATEAFALATRRVAKEAFSKGISITGSIDGKRVIVHPDGTIEYRKDDNENLQA